MNDAEEKITVGLYPPIRALRILGCDRFNMLFKDLGFRSFGCF